MQLKNATVGFVTARNAYSSASNGGLNGGPTASDDSILVDAGTARLVHAFQQKCGGLVAAMSRANRRLSPHTHRLEVEPADFYWLPWIPSTLGGLRQGGACRRAIRAIESRCDALVIQLPFAAPTALLRPQKPRVYHIFSDLLAVTQNSPKYKGWRRYPAVALGVAIDRLQQRFVRSVRTRTVTNGRDLFDRYGAPPGRCVVSATISESEIMSQARSRPADDPFRVLYVGYLRYEKGIDILLDAFEIVLTKMPQAQLEIVGGIDTRLHGMTDDNERRLANLAKRAIVLRTGHCEYGPKLFQRFADADLLAVPSRSEGTPRVLIEARAFGCPVVGTRVGGIPYSIEDTVDGLIVPPGDADSLAEAILKVAAQPELRRQLIAGGLQRACRTTVESFANNILEEVQIALDSTGARR